MAPRVVYLHIGTTKTGTTFIQRVLWANQKSLEKNDVIMPAKGQYGFGRAARALHNWRPADEPIPGEWTAIADTINHSRKSSALISQEFLCWLNQEQVNGLVRSLGQSQVKVIVTARDLARLIPAQWQSAMRQRNTWTLTEYAHGVQHGLDDSDGADGREPYEHFWHRMDYGSILRTWSNAIGLDNVTVVTVPPSGSDPDELWRRFCLATDLKPSAYTTSGVANASLGAASCEVMRRLNGLPAIRKLSRKTYAVEVNGTLTRRVMDRRGVPEPKITLPEGQREWVMSKAEEIIADIEGVGPKVIGSLDDLRPRPFSTPYQAPEDLPTEMLLEAALDALGGLAVAHATGDTAPKPGHEGRKKRGKLGEARDRRGGKPQGGRRRGAKARQA